LAKIVGFDVTPATARSLISSSRRPSSISSRESVSSQIATPRSVNV
jgi:hypothetical protein